MSEKKIQSAIMHQGNSINMFFILHGLHIWSMVFLLHGMTIMQSFFQIQFFFIFLIYIYTP